MPEISKAKAKEIAHRKMSQLQDMDLDQADAIATATQGLMVGVPRKGRPMQLDELKRGATVASLLIENSPRRAQLQDGIYSIKIWEGDAGWIAQFLKDGDAVETTTDVRIYPTQQEGAKPEIFVIHNFVVFLLGVIVGMGISCAIHSATS